MISFSVLCTNPRHGGQCELLIDANSASEAELHVHNSRPHYIVKDIWPVEKKFICHGWCSRNDRYDALAYLTASADEARAICERLHPDFVIDSIEQETSSFIQDQLISMVARFICEAKAGDMLMLPAMAALHKREDGRICMSRRGSLPMPLWEPLSHDIVATIVRWSKEDLQAA